MPILLSVKSVLEILCLHVGRTIVSHCLEIYSHEIGQQECVALTVPCSISYMQGIRGIRAASRGCKPGDRHFVGSCVSVSGMFGFINGDLLRSPVPRNAPCDGIGDSSGMLSDRLADGVLF